VRSRGPGHEKEATALLASWFIFNIILYLLFMTLIILFEELPKDSVNDSCLGRVPLKVSIELPLTSNVCHSSQVLCGV
jgi:hypothetical protein